MSSTDLRANAVHVEPDPVIEAYKKHVDRTLLRQNLRRSMDERWKVLTEATRLAEQMRRAGARARETERESLLRQFLHGTG